MKVFSRIQAWLAPGGISLAWRQLSYDKKRFATAIAGVSFGVIIMLFQQGIYQAFQILVIRPFVAMQGELALISPDYQYLLSPGHFPERRLYQTIADRDVEAVYPVSISYQKWRNPETGGKIDTALFGVYAGRNPFIIPEVASREDVLTSPESILFDDGSSPDFGDVAGLFAKQGEIETEINDQRIRVSGIFSMGQTLAAYGHVIAGMETYQRLSGAPSGTINFGMIRLKPGADPEAVAERLRKIVPEDVSVLTRGQLIRREQVYWQNNTPVGFITISGMILAMFVGAVIVYQILYTDINDHLKEYATLTAIGLGPGYFVKFILSESLILLVIGFIPGLLVTALLFLLAESSAELPTRITLFDTMLVFCMAAIMCLIAGFLATRRLRSVDPADIF